MLLSVATLAFTVDQVSKWVIVTSLELREHWVPLSALEDIFDITYTRNTGAAFGLGQEFGNVFLVIAVVVVGVILYYYRTLEANWVIRVALGLMMGGAIGNAVDRVFRGYVVDFLHLHGWPIFNVADSVVVLGVALWVAVLWWEDRQLPDEETDLITEEQTPR